MRTTARVALKSLFVGSLLWAFGSPLQGAPPDAKALNAALSSGEFASYLESATEWLKQQLPAEPTAISATALQNRLKDANFAKVLDQRQLIFKTRPDKLGAFAKADPANQAFLTWLLDNTAAMDLYLEAVVPLGQSAREQNSYVLSTGPLEIWKTIIAADPDAREGIYLRLAIATAIAPPGTGSPGAGQAKTPVDPVSRYLHFKAAHKNKELFPSFDNLTVWEYTKVVQSGASNEDLAWGRQMINTWRPDLRVNEQVVNSTSEVWRRNSPISFDNCYKNVLAGGGKCGPRSSWSVFICQAFGIPAIGVGQPAHACVAYKAANPMTEPQPGSAWKVGYGRGWQVSKLEGMSGPEFLASVEARSHAAEFSQVEHLRWLASAVGSTVQATAIMDVAHSIATSAATRKTDITASLKPEEAEKEIVAHAKAKQVAATKSADPIKVSPDVTRIEASALSGMSAAQVFDSYGGGKQVNFGKSIQDSWVEYTLDVPATGTYTLEMQVAAANLDQVLNVKLADHEPVTIKVPHSAGLWGKTPVTEIKLEKGRQSLRVSAPFQRGVALRYLELKAKG